MIMSGSVHHLTIHVSPAQVGPSILSFVHHAQVGHPQAKPVLLPRRRAGEIERWMIGSALASTDSRRQLPPGRWAWQAGQRCLVIPHELSQSI